MEHQPFEHACPIENGDFSIEKREFFREIIHIYIFPPTSICKYPIHIPVSARPTARRSPHRTGEGNLSTGGTFFVGIAFTFIQLLEPVFRIHHGNHVVHIKMSP